MRTEQSTSTSLLPHWASSPGAGRTFTSGEGPSANSRLAPYTEAHGSCLVSPESCRSQKGFFMLKCTLFLGHQIAGSRLSGNCQLNPFWEEPRCKPLLAFPAGQGARLPHPHQGLLSLNSVDCGFLLSSCLEERNSNPILLKGDVVSLVPCFLSQPVGNLTQDLIEQSGQA